MKQFIFLALLFTPIAYAQDSLKTTCINKNIERIKTQTECQSYIEEIKAIKQPNCMYSSTISATTKIMTEAKKNSCVIEPPVVKRTSGATQRVFNYSSTADLNKLKQYIEAYNEEIGLN